MCFLIVAALHSQVGFYDIVVVPLYHSFGRVFPGCQPMLSGVMNNYRFWSKQAPAPASPLRKPSMQAVATLTVEVAQVDK